ncbi:hypothetical protein [Yoonia sp.]|uniref:hypothetical protein n=1 Tax=Yoonia sp. TaxID=2212373 RepID=UPI00358EAB06
MIKTSITVAALSVLAVPAFAQEVTYGAFSLDYSNISPEDGGADDITTFDLEGEGEYTNGQFLIGAGIANDKFEVEDDFEFTVRTLNVYAGYAITPEALVGAGYTSINLDEDGFGDEDINGFDIFGQYQTGAFGVAVNYSRPDEDFDDFDITTFYAQAEVAPGVTLGGIVESVSEIDEKAYLLSAEYDAGQIFGRGYYVSVTEQDFAVFGARGEYRFDQAISLTAGFESTSGDDFFDYTSLSVGGEYAFAPGVAVSARYTKIDADEGGSGDIFALGLTYEFGARQRLDQKMADAAFDDLETGIFGTQPNIGLGFLAGTEFGGL